MKKITWIYMTLLCLFVVSCEEAEIPDAPNYDKTDILSFKTYDLHQESVLQGNPMIDAEAGTISVTVSKGTDLSHLFITCSLSPGANITPAVGGYQDWSIGTRQFTVTSASGSRSKQWTITLVLSEK